MRASTFIGVFFIAFFYYYFLVVFLFLQCFLNVSFIFEDSFFFLLALRTRAFGLVDAKLQFMTYLSLSVSFFILQ